MEQKKWWDNPTAAVGALMGDKAQAVAECKIEKLVNDAYREGYRKGAEEGLPHGSWIKEQRQFPLVPIWHCPFCEDHYAGFPQFKHCPNCGALLNGEVIMI